METVRRMINHLKGQNKPDEFIDWEIARCLIDSASKLNAHTKINFKGFKTTKKDPKTFWRTIEIINKMPSNLFSRNLSGTL